MPSISYSYNFLQGLSSFWQKFFADSPQLESLYRGTAFLVGQAYLDLLSNVLSLSIADTPLFQKSMWKLITAREDQIRYVEGAPTTNRWTLPTPDGIAGLVTLDNRIIEPTASLQFEYDFDFTRERIAFWVDPTNPPLPGYARRQLDIPVGGAFDALARKVAGTSWITDAQVQKGDTLRFLRIASNGAQSLIGDYLITVVRDKVLYTPTAMPPDPISNINYVILRRAADADVVMERFTFSGSIATLANTRLIPGTLHVFGTRSDGAAVVEGVDYTVDYQLGKIHKVGTWSAGSANRISYEWLAEVVSLATDGMSTFPGTTRVTEVAFWAPDVIVDKRTLSNNFGSLIGIEADSSEAYRALLKGVFQLYTLGPVLERFESALNVILGLPVIRHDGETFVSIDTTPVLVNRITTSGGTYDFPKATPLRTDLTLGRVFEAFEPLTTAARVTDYVEDPTWWHHITIPSAIFGTTGAATILDHNRRSVSPLYVAHVAGALDDPRAGDPGLFAGADDEEHVPAPGVPIYRHRCAFVLMDRFYKAHMFYVQLASNVFVEGTNVKFAHSPDDLQKLIQGAKPAHTYAYMQPLLALSDVVTCADDTQYYQPQRYLGADTELTELFDDISDSPDPGQPYVKLGLALSGSAWLTDLILPTDETLIAGLHAWTAGDYFHYETYTDLFASVGYTITLGHAPTAPRRRRVVSVYIASAIVDKPLVEGIDYTVNYTTGVITRITEWDRLSTNISFVQLNIGNVGDAPADTAVGDMTICAAAVDPALGASSLSTATKTALIHALDVEPRRNYPSVTDAPDDLSFTERALTITIA